MSRITTTYILCQTALLRDGMRRILADTSYRVAGADRCLESLRASPPDTRPLLFIVFVDGQTGGSSVTVRAIKEYFPSSKIVVLAAACDSDDLIQAFRLGATGYLINTITASALVKSFDVVMADGIVLPSMTLPLFGESAPRSGATAEQVAHHPVAVLAPIAGDRSHLPTLSAREALILQALVTGDSNKHIARKLNIAEATVKVHVKAILRKVRVRNRTQAAIWAMNNGQASEAGYARSETRDVEFPAPHAALLASVDAPPVVSNRVLPELSERHLVTMRAGHVA
ncbi:response regulator transcription factor [Hansschlegelia zhihuaiae]|nr:response regulator transcription factor [Hansschlegelia zhihuaiae]